MGRESYRRRASIRATTAIAHRAARALTLAVRRATTGAALLALTAPVACDRSPAPGASPGAPHAKGPDAPASSARDREHARRAAEQYLSSGRIGEAKVITTRLVEVAPEGPLELELHARVLLAEALTTPGDGGTAALGRAADAYERAAYADPANAALRHAAGVALDQAGRLDAALRAYESACRLDAANAQYQLYRGLALRRLDRTEHALEAFDRAAELEPDAPSILVARADALLQRSRAEAALDDARRARTIAPSDLGARVVEARALRALDRSLEAATMLSALDAAARADEAVALELAESLRAVDRPSDAARAWEHALAADPRRWRCALGAAEAWLEAGDLIRARERATMASELAPRSQRASRIDPVLERIRAAALERDQRSERPPSTGR